VCGGGWAAAPALPSWLGRSARPLQVEALEEENEQAEAMLSKLKSAVGAIFDKYFSSQIDEQDAIKQVKELGLEISVDLSNKLTDRRWGAEGPRGRAVVPPPPRAPAANLPRSSCGALALDVARSNRVRPPACPCRRSRKLPMATFAQPTAMWEVGAPGLAPFVLVVRWQQRAATPAAWALLRTSTLRRGRSPS
jgi:hypothetical protein